VKLPSDVHSDDRVKLPILGNCPHLEGHLGERGKLGQQRLRLDLLEVALEAAITLDNRVEPAHTTDDTQESLGQQKSSRRIPSFRILLCSVPGLSPRRAAAPLVP